MFNKNPRKALFLAIITILMWSTVATGFEIALKYMTPNELQALALSLSSIILIAYMYLRKSIHEFKKLTKADYINALLQGFCLCSANFLLLQAYDFLPAQIVQPINSTWSIAFVLINSWLVKERLRLGELFGFFLAISGTSYIALGGSWSPELAKAINIEGILSVLSSVITFAFYFIFNSRANTSAVLALLSGFIVASVLSWIAVYVEGGGSFSFDRMTITGIYAVIYLALFEWALPFLTWSLALKLTNSVSTISIISFFNPFLSLLCISIVLGEPIVSSTIFGLCLIVAGTAIQQRFKKT